MTDELEDLYRAFPHLNPLYGIPAAIGVDEPLTHRPGEYMGISREQAPHIHNMIRRSSHSQQCSTCGHIRYRR